MAITQLTLQERLRLAKVALLDAQQNATNVNKNMEYWKSQVEQERKLVESLELEISNPPAATAESAPESA